MPQRLYLGRLAPDAKQSEVEELFKDVGRVTECRVMTGFGFIEFEDSKDAEDAVTQFNGKNFLGQPLIVEFARESRRERGPPRGGYDDRRGGYDDRRRDAPFRSGGGRRGGGGYRISVSGLSRDTSWQDLKDFGREAGNVTFADVDRDYPGSGVLEYTSQDDADYAVRKLDGKDLRGVSVRLEADSRDWRDDRDRRRSPPPRRSRSPRRDDRDRERRRSRSPRRDDRERRGGEDRYERRGEDRERV